MQVDSGVEVEVEEALVVEGVQWEQEGSSVRLLLSMCSLVGLEGVAAQPVCVFTPNRDLRCFLGIHIWWSMMRFCVRQRIFCQVDYDQEVVDG